MAKSYLDDQQRRIEKADRTYKAFMKTDQGSMRYKDYFNLVARTDRMLRHAIDHVRQYDTNVKDFTPQSKELARKWWEVRKTHYNMEIDGLAQRLLEPRKRTDCAENLEKKAEEMESERRFVKGSLKILYGISPGR